jgi:hypothetical protein
MSLAEAFFSVLFAPDAGEEPRRQETTTETIKAESLFAELRYMPFLRSIKRNNGKIR